MTARARQPDSGISLIEVIVVMALIAVGSGAAMLSLGDGGRDTAPAAEARRLAAHLNLAVDEAILRGRGLRLEGTAAGYRFVLAEGSSGTLPEALQAPHSLPEPLRLTLEGAAQPWTLPIRPTASGPSARLSVATPSAAEVIVFDGLTARRLTEPAT